METPKILAIRFREVMLNGKWIANTNYKDQLSEMDWETATMAVASLNSIALLTFHIHYYVAGVLNVLKGGSLDIRDKYSFDMPAITSEEEWKGLCEQLWKDSELFAQLVEQMPAEQLGKPFVNEEYGDYQRNINAMIEHAYYHLAQIVLVRKMIGK